MVGVSLLYRYADFVTLLGGTEFHLGWIVGVGMVGSLVTRVAIGSYIDRHGARLVWLGSTALFVATCLAHLAVGSHTGVAIYLLRISYCCAVAGVYGASVTFVSAQGPSHRMAELIGMLGTSGFLGTVVGTLLGDFLLGAATISQTQVDRMFIVAALLGTLSFPLAWAATWSETKPTHVAGPSLLALLSRHQPGAVLVVGVAIGAGFGLPSTFLRTYAAGLDIPRIGLFFVVYAASAMVTRVITRQWPERFGTRPMILVGTDGPRVEPVAVLAGPGGMAVGLAGARIRMRPCDPISVAGGRRQRPVSQPTSRIGDHPGPGRMGHWPTPWRPGRRRRVALQRIGPAASLPHDVSRGDGRCWPW